MGDDGEETQKYVWSLAIDAIVYRGDMFECK